MELWDVSGDRAFEGGWPAIMHGALGIVYVYDALSVGQDKDLEEWHRWFGQTIGLKDSQVLGVVRGNTCPEMLESCTYWHFAETTCTPGNAGQAGDACHCPASPNLDFVHAHMRTCTRSPADVHSAAKFG